MLVGVCEIDQNRIESDKDEGWNCLIRDGFYLVQFFFIFSIKEK